MALQLAFIHDRFRLMDDAHLARSQLDADLGATPTERHRVAVGLHLDERIVRYTAVDRKSTRLNSSHANISYAVFCLKKKKKKDRIEHEHGNTTELPPTPHHE